MKTVKSTDQYTVYQKRSGRYAVKSKQGKSINEQDKVAILLSEGLIVAPEPKAVEPEAEVEEAAGEEESTTGEAEETEATSDAASEEPTEES